MNSSITWIKDVRSSVKRAYGSGWVIEEQSGKVKILRRMPDGRRPAFITNLKFAPSSFSALVELFAKGVKNMEELDKPFKEAFSNLMQYCDDTKELGYELLWQGEK